MPWCEKSEVCRAADSATLDSLERDCRVCVGPNRLAPTGQPAGLPELAVPRPLVDLTDAAVLHSPTDTETRFFSFSFRANYTRYEYIHRAVYMVFNKYALDDRLDYFRAYHVCV